MNITIDGVVYEGFCRLRSEKVTPSTKLNLIWFDGEPELWLTDSLEGEAALLKFYTDEWGSDRIQVQRFNPDGQA